MTERKDSASRPKRSKPLGDYEVGYGRPPVASRFVPGQSGNPKGRPKGERNFKTVVGQELERKMTVREGGRERQLTRREIIGRVTVDKACKGDEKAIRLIRDLDGSSGPAVSQGPDAAPTGPTPLDQTDRQIIAEFAALIRTGADLPGVADSAHDGGDPDARPSDGEEG